MASKAADTTRQTPVTNIIQAEFGGIPKGGVKAATLRRTEVLWMTPSLFQLEPGWNKRNMGSAGTRAHIDAIRAAISEMVNGKPRGISANNPLTFVQKDGAWLIRSGHCRFTAVSQAIANGVPITEIPVVRASEDPREQAISQFSDNNSLPFSPIEKGAHYSMLRDEFGMTLSEIAQAIGESRTASHVSQCIGYFELLGRPECADIMEMIDSGYLSVSLAKRVIDENNEDGDGISLALFVLRGASEIAKERGANKVMPKHIATVYEKHRADYPEIYAGEETEVVENTSNTASVVTTAEGTPGGGGGKTGGGKVGRTKGTVVVEPPPELVENRVERRRDETCTDMALLIKQAMERNAARRKLHEIFDEKGRETLHKFVKGMLEGKWE